MEFHDPKLGIGKVFGQESTVVKTMKGLDTVESLSVEASGFTKTVGLYLQNLSKIFLVL